MSAAAPPGDAVPAAVRAALAAVARQLGHGEPLRPEQRLVEDLGLDSLGLLTLAVEVEDRLEVCLDADDEAAIRTVGDLQRVLAEKLRARGGAGDG
ncbi:MAG TPA: phosphopantetheine-binding protein [Thermoanaerobaculia bacterium]|nr:phosphopantetheine-binding protein [Thermoanaerobaculia bacterium]